MDGVAFDFGSDSPAVLPCVQGDVVVIFAWRGYPAAHETNPVGKLSLNLTSTLALLSQVAARRVAAVVYASTGGAVYGDTGCEPVGERTAVDPMGYYGIGKATAEMYVRKVCREAGLKHIILRVGNAYGEEQIRRKLSVGFIAAAVAAGQSGDELQVWGRGDHRRDYVYIDDVADAFVRAACTATVPEGTYNVGSGISTSNRDVVELVEQALGVRIRVNYLPPRGFDISSICLDPTAWRKATGWMPKVSLEEGIRRIARLM